MARPPRRGSTSGIHHVMNRGVDRQAVFFADADRVEFGRRLATIHEERGVAVLAYCLMANHFHLLLRAPPGALPGAMQHLSGVYTRHTNDRIGRDGPLFRGRYHSIPVETDAYLLQAARYVHRNPLALRGVDSPRAYRWSSYRSYVGLRPAPSFLDVAPVTELLGGQADDVVAFTEEGASPPGAHPAGVEDVRQLVACAIAVDDLHHATDDTGHQRLDRTVLTLLADRCADPELAPLLVAALGDRSPRAAAMAARRARRRLASDPMVRRIVVWVEAQLAASQARSGSDPLRAGAVRA